MSGKSLMIKISNMQDCSTCTNKLGLDTYQNTKGFFTEYSKDNSIRRYGRGILSFNQATNIKIQMTIYLIKRVIFIKDKLNKIDNDL